MNLFLRLFRAYFPHISLGWWLIVLSLTAAVFMIGWLRTGWLRRSTALAAFVGYAFFLLTMTVLARSRRGGQASALPPLYSYRKILEHAPGSFEWACLDIFNCLLYLPLGFFYAVCSRSWHIPKKHVVLRASVAGFVLSLFAETLQLLLRRGTFECDDILHNTIGTFFGCLIGALLHSRFQ